MRLFQLQKRICEEVKEKDENKMALIQTEKKERLAREEISSLLIKLNEQEQMHHRIVNDLKRDIQDLVATEQKNVEEMVTSMKAEKSQLETEIANLRVSSLVCIIANRLANEAILPFVDICLSGSIGVDVVLFPLVHRLLIAL